MSSNIDSEKIAARLKNYRRAVVLGHVFPDADAIGSAGGLALGLLSLGIDVIVHLREPIPERMKVLVADVPFSDNLPGNSAIVVVDTASRARVGMAVEELPGDHGEIVNIDHHISNPGWADYNLVKGNHPACASIILEILEACGAKITSEIANLLFAGLLEDTGSFRFSNSNKVAFDSAARLLSYGAEPEYVSNQIYFNVPERVLKLRGLAIPKIKKELDGKLGLLTVTDAMLAEAGATADDTEGLIDEVRSMQGVAGAVMIREREEVWKVSLRSKSSKLDVNKIASQFGGGGHKAASGCTVDGAIGEVESKLISAFKEALS